MLFIYRVGQSQKSGVYQFLTRIWGYRNLYRLLVGVWNGLVILESNLAPNGTPLQCSCLENPRDGGAWWAAICGVTQSWTQLKWLSSSSSSSKIEYLHMYRPGNSVLAKNPKKLPHCFIRECIRCLLDAVSEPFILMGSRTPRHSTAQQSPWQPTLFRICNHYSSN